MAQLVNLELIDRNMLISRLMQFEVDVSGGRHARYLKEEVERFLREEIVQLVREQPYIRA